MIEKNIQLNIKYTHTQHNIGWKEKGKAIKDLTVFSHL